MWTSEAENALNAARSYFQARLLSELLRPPSFLTEFIVDPLAQAPDGFHGFTDKRIISSLSIYVFRTCGES